MELIKSPKKVSISIDEFKRVLTTEFSEEFVGKIRSSLQFSIHESNTFHHEGKEYDVLEFFFEGMRDRMVVSYAKYGAIRGAYPHKVNAIESLRKRIQKYKESLNTEFLMDAANFAMIEYILPMHVNACGPFALNYSNKSYGTNLDMVSLHLDWYMETGNKIYLIELTAWVIMEFEQPSLRDAFYKPTDSDESPGRFTRDQGRFTDFDNHQATDDEFRELQNLRNQPKSIK